MLHSRSSSFDIPTKLVLVKLKQMDISELVTDTIAGAEGCPYFLCGGRKTISKTSQTKQKWAVNFGRIQKAEYIKTCKAEKINVKTS